MLSNMFLFVNKEKKPFTKNNQKKLNRLTDAHHSIAARNHHFDGSASPGFGRFERRNGLLQLEAMGDERLDVDPTRGDHLQGSRVAKEEVRLELRESWTI